MARFLYLFRGGAYVDERVSEDERTALRERWRAWTAALLETGHLEPGGQPLDGSGRTVRGVHRSVSPGPHAGAQELVTGTLIVRAADLDEATERALGCPIFEHGGSVEVRPILDRAR